jgi:HK97 family phage prohead protease
MSKIEKGFDVQVKAPKDPDPTKQQLVFRISTGSVDRMNDTVNPKGFTNLAKAGGLPFLWAHDATLPPIGKIVKAWQSDGAVDALVEFTPPDMDHPLGRGFGANVYRMYTTGFLNSVSIGFRAMKWRRAEDRDDNGIDFLQQELLETSAVPVPANAEATVQIPKKSLDAVKSWAESRLVSASSDWVHRDSLATFAKALSECSFSEDVPEETPEEAPEEAPEETNGVPDTPETKTAVSDPPQEPAPALSREDVVSIVREVLAAQERKPAPEEPVPEEPAVGEEEEIDEDQVKSVLTDVIKSVVAETAKAYAGRL